MANVINLYLDDSGPRHPDHKGETNKRHDWFSLGGVLISERDEDVARSQIAAFKERWKQIGSAPLHSVDIRNRSGKFRWLLSLSAEQKDAFFSDLDRVVAELPVIGLACVIDRPGYNHRYFPKYGRQRWSLCKTAFTVLVERGVKYAIDHGAKLRVLPEKCSRKDDRKLLSYFNDLKANGHPFDGDNANKYAPLTAEQYRGTLYEFKLKEKSSPLAQVADLFLWPMSVGGYHRSNRTYSWLLDNQKLMDCLYPDDVATRGIKYSCFDLVEVAA